MIDQLSYDERFETARNSCYNHARAPSQYNHVGIVRRESIMPNITVKERIPLRITLLVTVCLVGLACVACAPLDSAQDEQATPAGTSGSSGAATDPWDLWTADSALRGANVWNKRVNPELDGTEFLGPGPIGPPYSQADYDALAALGANYVNISYPGAFTEKRPFELDAEAIAHLDEQLDMIGEAGMWAVIAFRTGPGRSELTFNREEVGDWFDPEDLDESVWTDSEAQDAWVEMWRYTADHYRGHPVVVGYDLMVEPNANDVVADEWDPETFYAEYAGSLADWNQLHPRISSAIREVDPNTPILVEGMSYGSVEWLPYLELPDVPRVVTAVHQYEPQDSYTHVESTGGNTYPGAMDLDWDDEPDTFDREWLAGFLETVERFEAENGTPVVVNEFGTIRWRPGAAAYLDDEMTLFEQHGWSHAYWQWAPDWEPLDEIDEFDLMHGPSKGSHEDDPDNELISVVRKHWESLDRP